MYFLFGWYIVTSFTIEILTFGFQMLNRISLRTFFKHDEALCILYHLGGWVAFLHMALKFVFEEKSFSQYLHCFRGAPVIEEAGRRGIG